MKALQGKLLFVKPEQEDVYAEFYSYTCRKFEYDSFWMKNLNTEDMMLNGIIEKKLP
jgi:hypothetical protein